jgi:hypothetical protein
MKKYYIVSILLAFHIISYAQSLTWSAPVTVATGLSNIYPRLTLMSGDLPLVIWGNTSTHYIYSAKYTGSSFTTPIPVHNSGIMPYLATWTGGEISSSGDTAYIVFSNLSFEKVYSVRSIDGGNSFGDTVRIDEKTESTPRMPSVAVNPAGNPVVGYMIVDSATMEPEYAIAHSTDGGLSYTSVIPSPSPPGASCDCCPPNMAVNGTTEALVFRNNISNLRNMWTSISTDGGNSFTVSAEIDQSDWIVSSCPSSGPSAIISGDSLISTWMSEGTTGDARIYLGTMNIADQQIGLNKQIYPFGISTQNFPVIAGNGDTLGIVWQGVNAGSQEVLFTYSFTGAAGLGVTVDTITKAITGQQSRPDLVYKNGFFHLVFRDSNGANVKYIKANAATPTIIEESKNAKDLKISPFFQNNMIILNINSISDLNAQCEIINSMGQKISSKTLRIKTGENHFNIPGNYSDGVYYINVTSATGENHKVKIGIIK